MIDEDWKWLIMIYKWMIKVVNDKDWKILNNIVNDWMILWMIKNVNVWN
jgi:hypothetical protein